LPAICSLVTVKKWLWRGRDAWADARKYDFDQALLVRARGLEAEDVDVVIEQERQESSFNRKAREEFVDPDISAQGFLAVFLTINSIGMPRFGLNSRNPCSLAELMNARAVLRSGWDNERSFSK